MPGIMGSIAGKASVSLGVFFQKAPASDSRPMVSPERKFAGTMGTAYASKTKRSACPKAAMMRLCFPLQLEHPFHASACEAGA